VKKTVTPKQQTTTIVLLKAGLAFFCCAILVLAWGLTLHQLHETKKSILKSLLREHANLATIIAENLSQVLDQGQSIALLAKEWTRTPQQNAFSDMTAFLYGNRAFNRMALYRRDGRLIYQSSPPGPGMHGSSASRHLAELVGQDRSLAICPFCASPETSWQVPLVFPLKNGQGLRGVMLLELDLGYVLNLFRNIEFGQTATITIQTVEGKELARAEQGGLVVGRSRREKVSGHAPLATQNPGDTFLHADAGIFTTAQRELEQYPFIITVCQDMQEVLAGYHQQKRQQLWTLMAITLAGLAGCYGLIVLVNRKHEYLQALADSDAINSDLINKLEQEHQKAVNAASHDPLTNLYNRRLFVTLAQKKLALARRSRMNYAILFVDLDRFKTINDTLGHRIGDLLLKMVAERLSGCVKQSDIVARFGGDEFIVMLADIPMETDIAPIVNRITTVLSRPYDNLDGHQIHTSPSIGIAIYPRDGDNIDALVRNADAAMYKSKRAGRGRYCFFDSSLNTVSPQQFELEQRLPTAIAENEFVLHYQPQIRLEDYAVTGLEALVRWQHPVHHLIYPGEFIATAEATGLIVDLGNWVLEEACRQLATWRQAGLAVVPVAVNVSPLQLREPDYAANVIATLQRHALQPADLEIEITESAFIENSAVVRENLQALCEHGIRITLDDFGNGFSSLSHVRCLPIKALKIDRSFISDIRGSHHDNIIVSSTITLAKKLDLTVVAEGVESHEQVVHLKMAGCDLVQGYYFSRPVPEEDIREFLVSPIRMPAS
jgi:diguanylate cyclase (GGDEF)-like protein